MVKVTGSQDCGNSPKNRFAQDVAVALEAGKVMAGMLSDAVAWRGVAAAALEGTAAVRRYLEERPKPIAITVEHAIAHGKVGMSNGETTFADGTRRRFSHVFDFTNAKGNCGAAISSYV